MNINEIKNNIINNFRENINSHAFLFVTNNIEECYKFVVDIVKKINCENNCKNNECKCCNAIEKNNNPDVVTISPIDKEIKVEQIKDLINQFTTKPIISKYSSYIIKEANKLSVISSNKLLKFLEEPDGEIIGFFITDNLEGILETIKSRCEVFTINFDVNNILDYLNISEDDFSKYYNEAMRIVSTLNNPLKYKLFSDNKELSKFERIDIDKILKLIKNIYVVKYEYLVDGLNKDFLKPIIDVIMTDDIKVIVKRINLLDNIIKDFSLNVNKDLFINKLFILWE